MLIINGYIHVFPEDFKQFMDDIQSLPRAARQRGGNYSYDITVEDYPAGKLLISERWKDQAALSAHLESTDTPAFIYRWENRMKGELLKYDAFNERTLMQL
ncbi:antibiotic biosynthesis monooxygenase [Pantoea stewartii subsp. indologenes]|uniref:putative quinol monooxygenase n=1 Tax=Pantoea stewartii TaxID=66269 RepID=UPI00050F981E|nr:antibiotic biosynthesis monooxygenase [Pantoea stewartii]KGD84842.1 antibiotic biosynthesis monooxygenase [Pantoea stewartii subsp. indologenes]